MILKPKPRGPQIEGRLVKRLLFKLPKDEAYEILDKLGGVLSFAQLVSVSSWPMRAVIVEKPVPLSRALNKPLEMSKLLTGGVEIAIFTCGKKYFCLYPEKWCTHRLGQYGRLYLRLTNDRPYVIEPYEQFICQFSGLIQ